MLPDLITGIPGPESLRLARELRRHESRNVTHLTADWPVFWERAAGSNVWDVDGNRYLDLTSAFAVAGLGHGRRELLDALSAQAGLLLHGMGDVHPTRPKVELCGLLSALTFERWGAGVGKTVLSNSGFEAVETALKTAVLATGRSGVLSFEGGYHGLGYGALLPSGFAKFRDPFGAQLAPVATRLPFPRSEPELAALQLSLDLLPAAGIGAVVVEPIQGRGGIVLPPAGFLALLRDWCDRSGALLIFDEILTGFHRSGALFACEHEGVVPDLLCLGKALSGGFPISACVGRGEIMDAWPESEGEALHTSTFLGHPAGCAMALAALRLHQDPATPAAVQRVERRLAARLGELGRRSLLVRSVRGRGAMWGIELQAGGGEEASSDAGRILAGQVTIRLLHRGLLLLPGGADGTVLTLTPPFGMADEEIDFAVGEIGQTLEQAGDAAQE